VTRFYFHIRGGKVVGTLSLTDEKALDLLERGWNLRPISEGISL
jgi:hypothetical protein